MMDPWELVSWIAISGAIVWLTVAMGFTVKAQNHLGDAMTAMHEMLRLQSDEIVKMEDRIDKLECANDA